MKKYTLTVLTFLLSVIFSFISCNPHNGALRFGDENDNLGSTTQAVHRYRSTAAPSFKRIRRLWKTGTMKISRLFSCSRSRTNTSHSAREVGMAEKVPGTTNQKSIVSLNLQQEAKDSTVVPAQGDQQQPSSDKTNNNDYDLSQPTQGTEKDMPGSTERNKSVDEAQGTYTLAKGKKKPKNRRAHIESRP